MIQRINMDFAKIRASLKLEEVEERYDIYFSRPFGYYLALTADYFKITPNQVSIISLLVGIIAGFLFYFQNNILIVFIACLLLTLAGLLDSADGQLARMTGTSTDLGRKIDAIIDTFVFAAVYFGGGFYFLFHGYSFIAIAVLGFGAGWAHSVKSSVYEFYKTEYLYYYFGTNDLKIPTVKEVTLNFKNNGFWPKLLFILEKDYISKQAFFVGRKPEVRKLFEMAAVTEKNRQFVQEYRNLNQPILSLWAWFGGTNMHRGALMLFSLIGHMDYYFVFSIVTIFPIFLIRKKQVKSDKKLLELFALGHKTNA